MQQFVQANCELIVTLNEFFTAPPAGVIEQLPPELSSEWQEFFMEGIHNLLLPLLIKIPGESCFIYNLSGFIYYVPRGGYNHSQIL